MRPNRYPYSKPRQWQGESRLAMKQSHQSRRFNKLMKRERERMLNGKGVFRDAKRQLEGEAAEDFYRNRKPTRKCRKYGKTSHLAVS